MHPRTVPLAFGVVLPLLILSSFCLASDKPVLPDQARQGLETALGNVSDGTGEGIGQVVLDWMLDEDPPQGLIEAIHESLGLTVPPGSEDSSADGLEVGQLFGDGEGIGSFIGGLLDDGLRGKELAQAIRDSLSVGGGPTFDPPRGRPDVTPPHTGQNDIPEPATLSLLGLGAAVIFRRRRR